jgi:hypothetical protein
MATSDMLACYGDAAALADLVGDFDLRSPSDATAWYRIEWQEIADSLGFSQQLASAFAPIRSVRDDGGAVRRAGVEAFARFIRRQPAAIPEAQAAAQWSVLRQLAERGRTSGALWRASADPTTLDGGACFRDSDRMVRAFYPDTAPGYFGDGWQGPTPRAESACGWQTPLVLHLGTFPYVYSSRIDAAPAGLRWVSTATYPALEAMQVMASMMDPAANLRQDAQQAAAIAEHFEAHTDPMVARLPAFQPGRMKPGALYRRGGFLYVHQGSLAVAGLSGPRGYLAATAYNFIRRRLAVFFAVRQATLRALPALVPELQQLARSSSDACLRQLAQEGGRRAD